MDNIQVDGPFAPGQPCYHPTPDVYLHCSPKKRLAEDLTQLHPCHLEPFLLEDASRGIACRYNAQPSKGAAVAGLTSASPSLRDLTLTVWISFWRAQMTFPPLSMLATGSSRPILMTTVPSS